MAHPKYEVTKGYILLDGYSILELTAEDRAKKIGTIGHLIKLTRTTVGAFSLDDSLTIEKFEEQWKL